MHDTSAIREIANDFRLCAEKRSRAHRALDGLEKVDAENELLRLGIEALAEAAELAVIAWQDHESCEIFQQIAEHARSLLVPAQTQTGQSSAPQAR